MADSQLFDVIVVGGGPGGSVAAKRCAEKGFSTLLVEKKRLPRDKVCTGMIMGAWAHNIIRRNFGDIPRTVLTDPPELTGHRLHVAGTEPQDLEWPTPLTWRRDLDFWMLQGAEKAGATVREGVRVDRVTVERDAVRVGVQLNGATEEIRARYLIGADGAASVVRTSLFPKLKVRYSAPIRECYHGALDLDKTLIHWFFPKGTPRPRFNVNHKNDVFLLEGAGIKELRREINETLEKYGFRPGTEPDWKDGCPIALLHDEIVSNTFVPAHGNVMLIGDAAGLIFPITFEGIGSALKSGIVAAESVCRSTESRRPAAYFYVPGIKPIVAKITHLCSIRDELGSLSAGEPVRVAESLVSAYRETLLVQEQ